MSYSGQKSWCPTTVWVVAGWVLVDRPGKRVSSKMISRAVETVLVLGLYTFQPLYPSENPMNRHGSEWGSRFFRSLRRMFTWARHPKTRNMERSGLVPFQTVYDVVSETDEDGVALSISVR